MKTTIEIPDPLLDAARTLARREGTTIKAVIERGLRRELAATEEKNHEFRLRRASFRGRGLRTDQPDVDWSRLREIAYEPGERK